MKIREIKRTDNAEIASIIRKVFAEHEAPRNGTVYSDPSTDDLYTLFQAEGSVFWIAEIDGRIVGCCGVYPTRNLPERSAELVKFYLVKEARGKGIGRRLLHMSIQWAVEQGYNQLYIESLPQFSNAVRIYEKLGFKRLEKPLGDSGHDGCTIWMLKDL